MAQKRTFVLLEILIAFLLVALSAAPLVTQPLRLYRMEMKFLEQMERERLADWSFSEIREKLLKNGIRWEELPERAMKTAPFPLLPAKIEIPGSSLKEVKRTFTLKCTAEKEGKKGEIYRSLTVGIDFLPKLFPEKKKKEEEENSDYSFQIIVQKLPLKTESLDKLLE